MTASAQLRRKQAQSHTKASHVSPTGIFAGVEDGTTRR